ncbi:hypothetical protein [Flavobacterium sp.]|jgi:hypothetical protein|uniref:hypothetical protein n=1 Tax=Flavobacterium sp. TaxID=239 RepID=UPI0037BF3EB7
MAHWTDKHINWQSLSAKEIRVLINTWGDAPAKPAKAAKTAKTVKITVPPQYMVDLVGAPITVKPIVRQKHTGADGEVKFVEHRNLYVGFWGGKVVVTKRTEAKCREFLKSEFGAE